MGVDFFFIYIFLMFLVFDLKHLILGHFATGKLDWLVVGGSALSTVVIGKAFGFATISTPILLLAAVIDIITQTIKTRIKEGPFRQQWLRVGHLIIGLIYAHQISYGG